MKGHVAVIQTMLSKGENVDAVTNVTYYFLGLKVFNLNGSEKRLIEMIQSYLT